MSKALTSKVQSIVTLERTVDHTTNSPDGTNEVTLDDVEAFVAEVRSLIADGANPTLDGYLEFRDNKPLPSSNAVTVVPTPLVNPVTPSVTPSVPTPAVPVTTVTPVFDAQPYPVAAPATA